MTEGGTISGLQVQPLRVGSAIGFLTFGLGTLPGLMVTSGTPVAALLLSLGTALLTGSFLWLVPRRRLASYVAEMQQLHIPIVRRAARTFSTGILFAGASSTLTIVMFTLALPHNPTGPYSAAGILLGLALWSALRAWDLHRWQEARRCILVKTAGDARFVLTPRETNQQTGAPAEEDGAAPDGAGPR